MKLAIQPANYLIEICTAKDDVLRTWEFMTLHPFQSHAKWPQGANKLPR